MKKSISTRLLILAATAVFWLIPGCGNKGPPVIPQLIVPQSPTDLKVKMDCNRIALTFTPPQINNDGSTIDDLEIVQIFRKRMKAKLPAPSENNDSDKTRSSSPSSDFSRPGHSDRIGTGLGRTDESRDSSLSMDKDHSRAGAMRGISFKDKVDSPYKQLVWLPVEKKFKKLCVFDFHELEKNEKTGFIDYELHPDGQAPFRCYDSGPDGSGSFQHKEGFLYEYQYRIRVINENSDYSPFSNIAQVYFTTPAAPPTDVQWRQDTKTIKLTWDPPVQFCDGQKLESEVSYNIYLREKNYPYPDKPFNSKPLSTSSYNMENIEQDKAHYCVITTITINPFCESAPSAETELTLKDMIAPDPPKNLIAIGGFNLVSLLWETSRDRDIRGYNVYRKTKNDAEWLKINEEIIPRNTFVDRNIDMTGSYTYAVTCVDSSPQQNESERSTIQKVSF